MAKYEAGMPASVLLKDYQEMSVKYPCLIDAIVFHEEQGSKTILEMANSCDQVYALWALRMHGADFAIDIRKILLNKVDNITHVLVLYINCDFWTKEEDKILESKFEDKKPQVELDLANGVVTRAKDSALLPVHLTLRSSRNINHG